MISRARVIALCCLALAFFVRPGTAALPDPAHCMVDEILVGDSNGMMIGSGFRVQVRDVNFAPIANSHVVLAFNGSARPYTAQVAPAFSLCPNIAEMTDAAGQAIFQARFGGYDNNPSVEVRADGITLKPVVARSTDLTGDGATGAFDFVHFRNNFLNSPSAPETDFNHDGITDPFDFNIFRSVFLNDAPGTVCP